MKRNTLFGGLALMAAGGVIGAGAMISSNAMADTAGAAPTDQLTMISIGDDGEAVQCTFEGADLDGLLPPAAGRHARGRHQRRHRDLQPGGSRGRGRRPARLRPARRRPWRHHLGHG